MEFNLTRSCPGLEVLDFRPHYPCFNQSDKAPCEEAWPCELREYWLEIHPFVDVTRAFLSYGSIIIIILGVLLNGLSFYILVSSGLAKNGSGIYLLALAVCDSGNLITNYAVGVWRGKSYSFNQHFMDNEWLCRFHGVFVEVFQTISAWIVVTFTIERCLAIWYPMVLRHTRKSRSKLVVASICSVFTLFSLSKLFLTGFEKDSVFGYTPCHSGRFVWQGMAYIRVALQTWIPTILVFAFNCLMFWKLRRIKVNRKRLTAYRRSTEPPTRKQSFINKPSPTNPMLIAVSLAYLILVFPLGLVQTVELYWNVHKKVPVSTVGPERVEYISWMMTKMLIKYIRSFCFGFYQINSSINFFLYFAAGLEFRLYLQSKIRRLCYCDRISEDSANTSRSSLNRNPKRTDSNSTTVTVTGIPSFPATLTGTRKPTVSLHPIEEQGSTPRPKKGSLSSVKSFNADIEVIINDLDQVVRSASIKNQNRVHFDFEQTSSQPESLYNTLGSSVSSRSVANSNLPNIVGSVNESYINDINDKPNTPRPSVTVIQVQNNTSDDDDDDDEEEDEVFYEAHEMSHFDLEEPGQVISHKSISSKQNSD